MTMQDENGRNVSRRTILASAGLAGVGLLMKGCSAGTSSPTPTPTASPGPDNNPSGGDCSSPLDVSKGVADAGNPDCVVSPELTEGPFYVNVNLIRSDITEDRTGVPLSVTIQLVEAETCTPIVNAAVEIWHCDAEGVYSDEAVENTLGQTWLRGTQVTDANGLATFRTIYPGWYSGRTPHIHAKAHLGSNRVLTTQFIFPDDLTDTVYANNAPYNTRNNRDTTNGCDMVVAETDHGDPIVLRIAEAASGGYTGGIVVGVA